jgi:hypothetical protein
VPIAVVPVRWPGVGEWGRPVLVVANSRQALLIFERKIFRRIYGPKYEDGEWKCTANRELEELSKGKNIVK